MFWVMMRISLSSATANEGDPTDTAAIPRSVDAAKRKQKFMVSSLVGPCCRPCKTSLLALDQYRTASHPNLDPCRHTAPHPFGGLAETFCTGWRKHRACRAPLTVVSRILCRPDGCAASCARRSCGGRIQVMELARRSDPTGPRRFRPLHRARPPKATAVEQPPTPASQCFRTAV